MPPGRGRATGTTGRRRCAASDRTAGGPVQRRHSLAVRHPRHLCRVRKRRTHEATSPYPWVSSRTRAATTRPRVATPRYFLARSGPFGYRPDHHGGAARRLTDSATRFVATSFGRATRSPAGSLTTDLRRRVTGFVSWQQPFGSLWTARCRPAWRGLGWPGAESAPRTGLVQVRVSRPRCKSPR
jgi:hypothetical protein